MLYAPLSGTITLVVTFHHKLEAAFEWERRYAHDDEGGMSAQR